MKVSRKKYCLAVLFMIATLLFTACNGTDLQNQKTNVPHEDENLIVIGVSQLGSESMWRTAIPTPCVRHLAGIMDIFCCLIMPDKSRKIR